MLTSRREESTSNPPVNSGTGARKNILTEGPERMVQRAAIPFSGHHGQSSVRWASVRNWGRSRPLDPRPRGRFDGGRGCTVAGYRDGYGGGVLDPLEEGLPRLWEHDLVVMLGNDLRNGDRPPCKLHTITVSLSNFTLAFPEASSRRQSPDPESPRVSGAGSFAAMHVAKYQKQREFYWKHRPSLPTEPFVTVGQAMSY